MKKVFILAIIFSVLTLGIFCSSIYGANADCKVVISGDGVVNSGSNVEYKISISGITAQNGIASSTFVIKYDTAFFNASTVDVVAPNMDGWDKVVDNRTQGTVKVEYFSVNPDTATGGMIPIKQDNKLVFTFKAQVLSNAQESSGKELYIHSTDFTDAFTDEVTSDLDNASVDIRLQKTLSKPTNLSLTSVSGKITAKCDAVEHATEYVFQLFKDGAKVGSEVKNTIPSYDFSNVINQSLGGEFSFKVKAVSSDEVYADSALAELDSGKVLNHKGTLSKPSIKLTVDKIKGTVSYTITDSNPKDVIACFVITVYKKGESEPIYDTTAGYSTKTGTLKYDGFELGKEYTVSVVTISEDKKDSGNNDSEEYKANVKPDGIVGIKLNKKPTLSYTEGASLDLSAMKVAVDFAVASDVTVAYKDFEKYGIKTSIKNGAEVLLSMNGKKISVTCGSFSISDELVLAVESSGCKHPSTVHEHEDPTCGVDGYDRDVCSFCGVTIGEETVLPATNNHTYTEWVWVYKPTEGIDGIRKRECTTCGHEFEETVPFEDYFASTDTLPPVSGDGTSEPDDTSSIGGNIGETTDKGGTAFNRLGNIGKIFLGALIAIFAIIVLFIVIAIWLESRRSRRRRSNARTNRARGSNPQRRQQNSSQSNNRNNYQRR